MSIFLIRFPKPKPQNLVAPSTSEPGRRKAARLFFLGMGIMGRMGMMRIMGIIMVVVMVMGAGCSRLKVEREYDQGGVTREKIVSYGLFVNRANQLRIDRGSNPIDGEQDKLESMIQEDASPGVEASRALLDLVVKGYLASIK